LPQGDHYGGTQGETQHHRMGDKVHQRAEAQQAEQPLEYPGEEGQQQDEGDVVLGAWHGQWADAGVKHDGDGGRGPADQVPGRAPQAGDQYRDDGGVEPVFGRETGDQCVGNRLRQRKHSAAEADDGIPADAGAGLARQPTEEGKEGVAVGPVHRKLG